MFLRLQYCNLQTISACDNHCDIIKKNHIELEHFRFPKGSYNEACSYMEACSYKEAYLQM